MRPRTKRRPRRRHAAYYTVAGVDLRAEMRRLCALEALGGANGPLVKRPPELSIRRASARPRSRLGVAWPDEHRISVTAYPGMRSSAALETLCHELVHLYLGRGRGREGWHGARFKATLHAAMAERFGLRSGPAPNAYHGHYAAAIERELTDQARLFDVDGLDGRAA
jgi:SprT-like family